MTEPTTNETNGTERDGWRLSRDVPISVVAFLVVQTLTFTWFLASQAAATATLVVAQAEQKMTRYSKEDAIHEREFQDQKFIILQSKLDDSIRRIAILEGQSNELLNRVRTPR